MAGCSCTGKLGNTGVPNVKPFGAVKSVYLVPLFDNNGNRNKIDLTQPVGAQILAMLYNADPSNRMYPYTQLDTYTEEEADATVATNQQGLNTVTRRGVRSVLFEKWGVNEQFFDKTKSACVQFGIYVIDNCNNLKGRKSGEALYPMDIFKGSHHSIFMNKTVDAESMVRFTMQYSDVENTVDKRWMIAECEHNIDLNRISGMFDVTLKLTKVDATNFTVQANYQYGTALTQLPTTGLVLANFSFKDGSGVTVTPSGISDEGNGLYTFTVTAVPSTLTATLFVTGTANTRGFEGKTTVTFP